MENHFTLSRGVVPWNSWTHHKTQLMWLDFGCQTPPVIVIKNLWWKAQRFEVHELGSSLIWRSFGWLRGAAPISRVVQAVAYKWGEEGKGRPLEVLELRSTWSRGETPVDGSRQHHSEHQTAGCIGCTAGVPLLGEKNITCFERRLPHPATPLHLAPPLFPAFKVKEWKSQTYYCKSSQLIFLDAHLAALYSIDVKNEEWLCVEAMKSRKFILFYFRKNINKKSFNPMRIKTRKHVESILYIIVFLFKKK